MNKGRPIRVVEEPKAEVPTPQKEERPSTEQNGDGHLLKPKGDRARSSSRSADRSDRRQNGRASRSRSRSRDVRDRRGKSCLQTVCKSASIGDRRSRSRDRDSRDRRDRRDRDRRRSRDRENVKPYRGDRDIVEVSRKERDRDGRREIRWTKDDDRRVRDRDEDHRRGGGSPERSRDRTDKKRKGEKVCHGGLVISNKCLNFRIVTARSPANARSSFGRRSASGSATRPHHRRSPTSSGARRRRVPSVGGRWESPQNE